MALNQSNEVNMTAENTNLISVAEMSRHPKPFRTPVLFPDQNITFITNPELRVFFESRQWSPVMLDEYNRQIRNALARRHEANPALGLMRDAVLAGDVEQACRIWLCMDPEPAIYVAGTLKMIFELPDGERLQKMSHIKDSDLDDYINFNHIQFEELERLDEILYNICLNKTSHSEPDGVDMKLLRYRLFGNPVDVFKYYRTYHQRHHNPVRVPLGLLPSVKDEPREPSFTAHEKRRRNRNTKAERARNAVTADATMRDASKTTLQLMEEVEIQAKRMTRKALRKKIRAQNLEMVGKPKAAKRVAKGLPPKDNQALKADQAFDKDSQITRTDKDDGDEDAFEMDALDDALDYAVSSGEIQQTIAQRVKTSTRAARPDLSSRGWRAALDRMAKLPTTGTEKEEVQRLHLYEPHFGHPESSNRIEAPHHIARSTDGISAQASKTTVQLTPGERTAAEELLSEQKNSLIKLRSRRVELSKLQSTLDGQISRAEKLMAETQSRIDACANRRGC
ncbi:MAG: hypothetical protein M1812_006288 [Candelaria pacifica]|nr:MAG: hypothetical protein M1812_006288 [Candelaria pacifica]